MEVSNRDELEQRLTELLGNSIHKGYLFVKQITLILLSGKKPVSGSKLWDDRFVFEELEAEEF